MIYTVSTTGSDSNSGSAAAPFATTQKAANLVKAGDTVIVLAGSYAGFIVGNDAAQAGTAAAPITFQADPKAAVGSVIIKSRNGKAPTGIDIEPGSDFVNIIGFSVTNDGSITKAGIKSCSNGGKILSNTVTGAGGIGGIFTDNASNTTIQGNTVTKQLGTNTSGHGMYISGTCDSVLILDNTIENNGYHGIHLNGDASEGGIGRVSNATISGNLITGNAGNGINGDGLVNATIEDNLITGYTKYGVSIYTSDAGVPSTGNKIVNNTFDGAAGSGIAEIQNGAIGTIYFNNILIGKSMIVDSTSGVIQSNNLTYATAPAGLFDSNFKLIAGSPAIGAGIKSFGGVSAPMTDLLGLEDPSGSVDCGCYSYQGAKARIPGDANGDGVVNFADYLILSANFNKTNATWAMGDFNGDGVVNYADYLILAANMNKTA